MENVNKSIIRHSRKLSLAVCCGLIAAFWLWASLLSSNARAEQTKPPAAASQPVEDPDTVPAADWAPDLLDGILSSPNSAANAALLRAAFAAGPAIIPQLERALRDDRTAEFAAQSLALLGGRTAIEILAKLARAPRDLGVRAFYYGSPGAFPSP